MEEPIPVINHAGLNDARWHLLEKEIAGQKTMERALQWFFAQDPPLAPDDIIAQDEFSYELLVPTRDGLYLSYDT